MKIETTPATLAEINARLVKLDGEIATVRTAATTPGHWDGEKAKRKLERLNREKRRLARAANEICQSELNL